MKLLPYIRLREQTGTEHLPEKRVKSSDTLQDTADTPVGIELLVLSTRLACLQGSLPVTLCVSMFSTQVGSVLMNAIDPDVLAIQHSHLHAPLHVPLVCFSPHKRLPPVPIAV